VKRLVVIAASSVAAAASAEPPRTIAGSVQLDYLAVPTDVDIHTTTFDGMTAELSLKMSVDFSTNASVSVKLCFACHGFEAAAGFVDLRAADELSVRIGRLTPEFGSFPQRYDPANHRTNDKPLPYDMGRMLHHVEWNEGILPAPWVDNGVELLGTRFIDGGRIDYAAYLLSGPKGDADAADIDFVRSREPARYYVDNNSEPTVGARLSGTADLDALGHAVTLGASVMAGHYDPDRRLGFMIAGVDAVANLPGVVLRAEYLVRKTDMAIGEMPVLRWKYGPDTSGRYDDHYVKHGFYAEAEVPIGRVDAFARFDGLLRRGNVLVASPLSASSQLLRYTAGAAIRITDNIRIKASIEYYQFNDLGNDLALHLGVATPF
jgi:opacity protein-like surface antigen